MVDEIRPYETMADRRHKADMCLRELAQTTQVNPIRLEGGSIARGFWGKAWQIHLDKMTDLAKRLSKGRNYVRNDAICHLEVATGSITAKVSGRELYDVEIIIDPLSPENWERLIKKCDNRIHTMTELLSGKFSRYAGDALLNPSDRFLPSESEIHSKCSCGSGASFCPHVSAALYGFANRLDRNPGNIFLLRGVDAEDLVSRDPYPEKSEDQDQDQAPAPAPALGYESPALAVGPIPPGSPPPAVVVRRRNGREERLELRDPSQDAQKSYAAQGSSSSESKNSEESVVKKKKITRLFSSRRRRTGWVSVDLGNDDKDSAGSKSEASPGQGAAATLGSREWADNIMTPTGDKGRTSPGASGFDPEQIAAMGGSGEDANGATGKRGGKSRQNVSKNKGTMPSPITSREELWRRIEAQQDPAERAMIHKKALELIQGANAKKMKKLEQKEAAAMKKATSEMKRKSAEKREKEAKLKSKTTSKTPVKTPTKRYPPKLAAEIPEIDFERVTGKNIRDLRKSMGWSLDVFSDRLGICKATVDRWEGTRGPLSLYTPSMEALKKLYKSIVKKFG